MELAIIVAMTPQGLIGKDNQIPWHLPADLKRFKNITMGHPIIMGRKTFESLPKILPGRLHIVLTRNKEYSAAGCEVANNWGHVARLVKNQGFVIGGADIYRNALTITKRLYITVVQANLEGDVYFPEWNKAEWKEIEREFRTKDDKNNYDLEYIQYERIT